MPSHMNQLDLILGTLALLLGFVFVLAAILESRLAKKAPFLNYFNSEYDRAQPRRYNRDGHEDDYPLRQTSFESVQINEKDPSDWPPT